MPRGTTARQWLSVLEASFIAFLLPPYHGNVSKRLIKSPKLYFYDIGLAAYLLGIESPNQGFQDPRRHVAGSGIQEQTPRRVERFDRRHPVVFTPIPCPNGWRGRPFS